MAVKEDNVGYENKAPRTFFHNNNDTFNHDFKAVRVLSSKLFCVYCQMGKLGSRARCEKQKQKLT